MDILFSFMKMFSKFLITIFHLMHKPQNCFFFPCGAELISMFGHCRQSPNKDEISVFVTEPGCIWKVGSHNF